MKPIEFIASEDLLSVYMKCKWHPYFKDLSDKAGGKFLTRNDDWECVFRIPMVSFLNIYKDLSEGFPIKLDPFLDDAIGEAIKTPKHEFNLEIIPYKGILPHITPKQYQLEAFTHAVHYGRSIVALPVGAGKSLVGKMYKEYYGSQFILLCPASIKYQWRKEIKAMTGKDAIVIDGTPKQREKQYQLINTYGFEWVIMNYETLVSDFDKIPDLDGIIIDEAHYLKNPDSKRTKAAIKYIGEKDKVLLLTGTFLVNSLLDGWALMKMLGRTGKQNFFLFKRNHCILDKYDNPVGFRPSIVHFKKDLRQTAYYRQKEEIMTHLPPRNDIFVDIQMDKDQEKFYRKLEDGILADIDNPKIEKELNTGAQFTRLRQAAADPHMIFPEAKADKRMSAKIDWLENFLESYDERTLIIYSPFDSFLERIKQELPNYPWVHINGSVATKKREELIEGARDSQERSFFLITDAVKTGKNIQFCQNFIMTTLPLTWADYDQLRGRIWREGQEMSVNIYHLMTLDTIDHSNWELISGKKDLMNDFRIAKMSNNDLKNAINNKKKE